MRISGVVLLATGLGACGLAPKGSIGDPNFWESSPLLIDSDEAELGLAELAKGNYGMAEAHFNKALDRDDRDVDALIGLGILYQNTGQFTKAQTAYESVLAIRPSNTQQMVVWQELSHRPISELASVNLALLQSGGVMPANAIGSTMPMPAFNPPPNGAMPGVVSGAPSGSPMMGRMPGAAMNGSTGMAASASDPGLIASLSESDSMIVSRFATMRSLRDQGLVTPDEYQKRRQANVGALVPLTAPPPAAGLDRPVPSGDQIAGRLRAIGRALEMRAITISQHTAERQMILDALMPAAPVSVANPVAPPQDLMMAADSIRRLEHLQTAGLISGDEHKRERSAIEQAIKGQPGPQTASAPSAAASPSASSGPQPALHLASYRSQQAADRGWAQLRRAHQSLIGDMEHEIMRVDLGPGKGIYYRLKVGPVGSQADVQSMCQQLKARRQYCEPSFLGAG